MFRRHGRRNEKVAAFISSDPAAFQEFIDHSHDFASERFAKWLDAQDPLSYTRKFFDINDKLIPFAGHSLGPVFKPAAAERAQLEKMQAYTLHGGHFTDHHPGSALKSTWFDRDVDPSSIAALRHLLGPIDDNEFIFTASGLSQNLANIIDTLYALTVDDWRTKKYKIAILKTEFTSDQTIIHSVLKKAIATAIRLGAIDRDDAPTPDDMLVVLKPEASGRYNEDDIIATLNRHASELKLIHMSEIAFSTGQRLELAKIYAGIADAVRQHDIRVGLDLAHTVGNRLINLKGFAVPIDYAVGCGYKHLCGTAGAPFGLYVGNHLDLSKTPPIQGWKAAKTDVIFDKIDQHTEESLYTQGAWAFRTSCPAPLSMLHAQVYLKHFAEIGFDKCFNKSECLTRYMIKLLQDKLGEHIEFVTPLEPEKRGATLVIRVKGVDDVASIEGALKEQGFEIDVRPPANIRLTAHYAYTRFKDIARMVQKLALVLEPMLQQRRSVSPP